MLLYSDYVLSCLTDFLLSSVHFLNRDAVFVSCPGTTDVNLLIASSGTPVLCLSNKQIDKLIIN